MYKKKGKKPAQKAETIIEEPVEESDEPMIAPATSEEEPVEASDEPMIAPATSEEEPVEESNEPTIAPATSEDAPTSSIEPSDAPTTSIEPSDNIYTRESTSNLHLASSIETDEPNTIEEKILQQRLLQTRLELILTMQKNFALTKKNAFLEEKLRSNAATEPTMAKRSYDDEGEESMHRKKQRVYGPAKQRDGQISLVEIRRAQQIRNKQVRVALTSLTISFTNNHQHLAGNKAAIRFIEVNGRIPTDEERAAMSEPSYQATTTGSPVVQQVMHQSPVQSAQPVQTQPATTPRRFGFTNMLGSIGSAVARTLTLTPRSSQPAQQPATAPAHIPTTSTTHPSLQHAVQNSSTAAATDQSPMANDATPAQASQHAMQNVSTSAATLQSPMAYDATPAGASQHDHDDDEADYDVPATPTPASRPGVDTSATVRPATTVARRPGGCMRKLQKLKQKTAEREAKEQAEREDRDRAAVDQHNRRLDAETDAELRAAHERRAQQASYDRDQDTYCGNNAGTPGTEAAGSKRKYHWWEARPGEFDWFYKQNPTIPRHDNGWVNINGKMTNLSEDDHEIQQQPPLKRRATGVQWDPILERGPTATPFSRQKGDITSILKPSYQATTGPSLYAGDPHHAQPYLGKLFADKSSYSDDDSDDEENYVPEAAKQTAPSQNDYISIGHTHHVWTGPKITPQPGSFSVPDDSDDESDDSDRDTSLMSLGSDSAFVSTSPQQVMDNEVSNNKFGQPSTATTQETTTAAPSTNVFVQTPSTPSVSLADSEALKRARSQAEKYKPKTPSGLSASSRIASSPLTPDVENVGHANLDAASSTAVTQATSEPEHTSAYYESLEYARDLANEMADEIPASTFVWPKGKKLASWYILTENQKQELLDYANSPQSLADGIPYWKQVFDTYMQEKAAAAAAGAAVGASY